MDDENNFLGVVINFFDHVSVAAIKIEASLSVGDNIRIVGGETDFEQKIESMQIHHDKVKTVKKGDEVGIRVKEKVRKGYKVYKV